MENTKHLIIVPPMSEPFKKLHAVLIEITDTERIEISEIENAGDLNSVISYGQSLVIFSNAKKCAIFLQENKSIIAKYHSKVILLVPKEVPGNLLAKLVKSGLTEAIIEGSPPKTLLHKVRIHLRSIKGGSLEKDNDDRVLKSNRSIPSKITDTINELSKKKTTLQEEFLEKKVLGKELGEAATKAKLAAAKNLKSEGINTNLNSKKKKLGLNFGDENRSVNFKNKKREKNIYYPLKKSRTVSLQTISEDLNKKNKLLARKERGLSVKTGGGETSSNLNNKNKNKRKDEAMGQGPNMTSVEIADYLPKNKFTKKELDKDEDPSDDINSDEKEEEVFLDENNEASKDQGEMDTDSDDLDRSKQYLESEAENEDEVNADENADWSNIKKAFEKRSGENSSEENRRENQDEIEIKKNDVNKKVIDEDGFAEDDSIESSDPDLDIEKDLKEKKIQDGDSIDSRENKLLEENSMSFEVTRKSYNIVEDVEENSQKNEREIDEDFYVKERREDVLDEMSKKNKDKNSRDQSGSEESDRSRPLSEDDLDLANNPSSEDNIDNSIHMDELLLKADESGLNNNKNTNNNGNKGKSNNLGPSHTKDDSKKSPYDWGNLVDKNESTSLDMSRNRRPQVDLSFSYPVKEIHDESIDYRRIKNEFSKDTISEEPHLDLPHLEEVTVELPLVEEIGPKKVMEQDFRGIEFCISIVKLIYNKNAVVDYFAAISKELVSQYKGYAIFYTYETSSSLHMEAFNTFTFSNVPEKIKMSWIAVKDDSSFDDYFTKTIHTWQCREIKDESVGGKFWEDIELPRWAGIELLNKKVELVFPYYDGVHLMGTAIIFFPDGINAAQEKSIIITLETARTVFLNTIQKKSSHNSAVLENKSIFEKAKGFFNLVSRLFLVAKNKIAKKREIDEE